MRGFLVSLHKALCIEISKSFRFKKSCVDYVSVGRRLLHELYNAKSGSFAKTLSLNRGILGLRYSNDTSRSVHAQRVLQYYKDKMLPSRYTGRSQRAQRYAHAINNDVTMMS